MFRSPSISGYIIFYMSIQDHTTSTTQDSKGRFVVYGNFSMLKYFKQNHCLYAKCSNALELNRAYFQLTYCYVLLLL